MAEIHEVNGTCYGEYLDQENDHSTGNNDGIEKIVKQPEFKVSLGTRLKNATVWIILVGVPLIPIVYAAQSCILEYSRLNIKPITIEKMEKESNSDIDHNKEALPIRNHFGGWRVEWDPSQAFDSTSTRYKQFWR